MLTTKLTDQRLGHMRRAAVTGVETLTRDSLAYFLSHDVIALIDELIAARAANERDRAAYCHSMQSLRKWCGRWMGMATSRGCYEWDDDEYRKEFQRAIAEMHTIADRLERKTHAPDREHCPTTQAGVEAALASTVRSNTDYRLCGSATPYDVRDAIDAATQPTPT